jgi:uncharacterized protein (UPF0297 family)
MYIARYISPFRFPNKFNKKLIYFRAHHAGDIIPGKFLPGSQFNNQCFIPYGGTEVHKDEFEVLMNTGFKWIKASNGYVPENSVIGGRSLSGEPLYVGRTLHNGQNIPGKICRLSKCIYIPFGEEICSKEYEVLVQILQPQPMSSHRSQGKILRECNQELYKNHFLSFSRVGICW